MSEVDFLVKVRDGATMIADACQERLEKLSPVGSKESRKIPAVKEEAFTFLKFEPQEGQKIGAYDVAYMANNPEDKWTSAFNILKESNATIKSRYHGEGYVFSYWLYGENKIYRQRLKNPA